MPTNRIIYKVYIVSYIASGYILQGGGSVSFGYSIILYSSSTVKYLRNGNKLKNLITSGGAIQSPHIQVL